MMYSFEESVFLLNII